jgi:acylphosphatase
MKNMKVSAHLFVSGKVQGVFFRVTTRDEATKRRVSGWVQNLSDGRVEAVFEGEREYVTEMIEFCRRGPSGAKVTRTDVQWNEYVGEFKSFQILGTKVL